VARRSTQHEFAGQGRIYPAPKWGTQGAYLGTCCRLTGAVVAGGIDDKGGVVCGRAYIQGRVTGSPATIPGTTTGFWTM
jgi:hypothetical protein